VILDSTIPSNPSAPLVATERVLWVGPLTVLTSVLAVQAVRLLVIQLPGVHTESVALGWVASTADTVILCTLAVLVLAGSVPSMTTRCASSSRWPSRRCSCRSSLL
jgi:hypothetical protein